MLALRSYLQIHDTTALLLDDLTAEQDDLNLHSLCHAVIQLEQLAPLYGGERRRLRVIKMRGTHFRGGYHDYVIRRGGLVVFPRLIAAEHHHAYDIDPSAATMRPRRAARRRPRPGHQHDAARALGVGKSSTALAYLTAALARGERGLILSFDEPTGILCAGPPASGWT